MASYFIINPHRSPVGLKLRENLHVIRWWSTCDVFLRTPTTDVIEKLSSQRNGAELTKRAKWISALESPPLPRCIVLFASLEQEDLVRLQCCLGFCNRLHGIAGAKKACRTRRHLSTSKAGPRFEVSHLLDPLSLVEHFQPAPLVKQKSRQSRLTPLKRRL